MNVEWMKRAVEEARKGEGKTAPNPPVGAVLVRDGEIIGRGYHHAAGMPHAEVEAFNDCLGRATASRLAAQGATLYVTLEPCSTQGRTPPCTERIIKEKVAKVVIGALDPNPCHAGRGVNILRKAGINVTVLNDEACLELIAPFRRWITTGRPFLTLKIAQTSDGFIGREGATRREPVKISCEESWQRVHALRQRVEAIMVGVGTVVADNPRLKVAATSSSPSKVLNDGGEDASATFKWRVIVDSHGRTPLMSNVCTDEAKEHTIIAVTEACPASRRKEFESAGVTVWMLPSDKQGRVDMNALCEEMGRMQWLHVLCEGGATLADSLLRGGHVDALHLITASWEMGMGVSAFNGFDIEGAFHWCDAFPVGTDLWCIGKGIH